MVLLKLFLSFLKIGLFAIGGAYSFLPLIERETVQYHHWLDKPEFLEVLGIVKIFPGAISIKFATYTGYKVAGIAIGNYFGGRIADRFSAAKTLAVLFGIISLECGVIVVLNNLVGNWMWLWRLSWPMRVFSQAALMFLIPSTLLGMANPVVVKMALDKGAEILVLCFLRPLTTNR